MEENNPESKSEQRKWRRIYGVVIGFLALEVIFFYYLSNLF